MNIIVLGGQFALLFGSIAYIKLGKNSNKVAEAYMSTCCGIIITFQYICMITFYKRRTLQLLDTIQNIVRERKKFFLNQLNLSAYHLFLFDF